MARRVITKLMAYRALCLALILQLLPVTVWAHPLDEYLQSTYLTLTPDGVSIEIKLTAGVLVAPQVIALIDRDGNRELSEEEGELYALSVVDELVLAVDGEPQQLQLTSFQLPELLLLEAGAGVIELQLETEGEMAAGTHQLLFDNHHNPVKSSHQANSLLPPDPRLTIEQQKRDDTGQQIAMTYTVAATTEAAITEAATAPSPPTPKSEEVAEVTPKGQEQLLEYLAAPTLTPQWLAVAFALAFMLGGFHALTPGHGKTLVAAYLIGSRGTVSHALLLGGIVTFTHTASVIAFGVLVLFAQQWLLPSLMLPILEILAGLLVVVLGLRLLWQRWSSKAAFEPHHHTHETHDHPHTHDHDHTHDGHHHYHHHLPPSDKVSVSGLVTMGISGGLVPCPEALSILLVAIALNRIVLGLGIIVTFSFGLAAVLIAIGILLVRAHSLIEKMSIWGGNWQHLLPRISAIVVTLLGMGILVNGLRGLL